MLSKVGHSHKDKYVFFLIYKDSEFQWVYMHTGHMDKYKQNKMAYMYEDAIVNLFFVC